MARSQGENFPNGIRLIYGCMYTYRCVQERLFLLLYIHNPERLLVPPSNELMREIHFASFAPSLAIHTAATTHFLKR